MCRKFFFNFFLPLRKIKEHRGILSIRRLQGKSTCHCDCGSPSVNIAQLLQVLAGTSPPHAIICSRVRWRVAKVSSLVSSSARPHYKQLWINESVPRDLAVQLTPLKQILVELAPFVGRQKSYMVLTCMCVRACVRGEREGGHVLEFMCQKEREIDCFTRLLSSKCILEGFKEKHLLWMRDRGVQEGFI